MQTPLPDAPFLLQILRLDLVTGKLYWKERPLSMFRAGPNHTAEQNWRAWNNKNAGKEAFVGKNKDGYFRGRICGVPYMAHRVIYKMLNGTEPAHIDHDDGNPSNNRGYNLIDRSQRENMRNRKLSSNNTSGHHGVSFSQKKGMWEARIHNDQGKHLFLGYFDDLSAAITARKVAEKEYRYHSNHGRI